MTGEYCTSENSHFVHVPRARPRFTPPSSRLLACPMGIAHTALFTSESAASPELGGHSRAHDSGIKITFAIVNDCQHLIRYVPQSFLSQQDHLTMVTNNEAVENFLNGKRNLAAYQFSYLIREQATRQQPQPSSSSSSVSSSTSPPPSEPQSKVGSSFGQHENNGPNATSTSEQHKQQQLRTDDKQTNTNCDEIAFNYAMVNLFTGCPTRASIIFSDLVKRYPRNPRLWLRLAESMLAAERSKMADEFEHIQQLANPHSHDHIIKSKNRPILIKINPNYCHQQKSQHSPVKAPRETPTNFLVNIKGYLNKSLDLINEYNDISLLTDDIPNISNQSPQLLPTTGDSQPQLGSNATGSGETPLIVDAATSGSTSPSTEQLSPQLSYVNPYKSISRSALYHLRIKVQLNLAYICLCMGEPLKALIFTAQCLKSSPQGYEKVLANLYHAEACILATRIEEAIQFLNLEVLNMAKSLSQDGSSTIESPKRRVVYGDEMQYQFDRGALATVVTYNLSVAYAAKGEFNNAQKILMRCIQPTKPIPMQLIICLLYIQLQTGQVEAAKKTILSNLPQFR